VAKAGLGIEEASLHNHLNEQNNYSVVDIDLLGVMVGKAACLRIIESRSSSWNNWEENQKRHGGSKDKSQATRNVVINPLEPTRKQIKEGQL
jgi:hypothetical protein